MKKLIASICFICALVGCSSEDNGSKPVDPIFSQPYIPLATLDDLEPGIYKYMGNKIGDRPVGLVSETRVSCKKHDFLDIADTAEKGMLYYLYGLEVDGNTCMLKKRYPLMINTKTFSNGYLTISTEFNNEQLMEIGFQGGYLRIEDYISDYTYTTKKEKVYLYFKKY